MRCYFLRKVMAPYITSLGYYGCYIVPAGVATCVFTPYCRASTSSKRMGILVVAAYRALGHCMIVRYYPIVLAPHSQSTKAEDQPLAPRFNFFFIRTLNRRSRDDTS